MSILGWIVVGIAFVGLHVVTHRGHSIAGDGRGHSHGAGGCCSGQAKAGSHEVRHPRHREEAFRSE